MGIVFDNHRLNKLEKPTLFLLFVVFAAPAPFHAFQTGKLQKHFNCPFPEGHPCIFEFTLDQRYPSFKFKNPLISISNWRATSREPSFKHQLRHISVPTSLHITPRGAFSCQRDFLLPCNVPLPPSFTSHSFPILLLVSYLWGPSLLPLCIASLFNFGTLRWTASCSTGAAESNGFIAVICLATTCTRWSRGAYSANCTAAY